MSNIYRVITSELRRYKKNGIEFFDVYLKLHNNMNVFRSSFLKKKKTPNRYDRHYLYFETKDDEYSDRIFYKLLAENEFSVDFLVNKYICTTIEDTQQGAQFGVVESWDLIGDFELRLQRENKEFKDGIFFGNHYPIYKFLTLKNYPKDNRGLIHLKGEYDHLVIDENNLCFTYVDMDDKDPNEYVTLDNIKEIYEVFYKHKKASNLDTIDSYSLTGCRHIVRDYERKERNSNATINSGSHVVLKVGDALKKEHKDHFKNDTPPSEIFSK